MTDYNNGEWHGWNGGQCPVHYRSVVDAVWHDPVRIAAGVSIWLKARELDWSHVVKFRVVEEHIELREFWVFGSQCFKMAGEAEDFKATMIAERPELGFETTEIIHMLEVRK